MSTEGRAEGQGLVGLRGWREGGEGVSKGVVGCVCWGWGWGVVDRRGNGWLERKGEEGNVAGTVGLSKASYRGPWGVGAQVRGDGILRENVA